MASSRQATICSNMLQIAKYQSVFQILPPETKNIRMHLKAKIAKADFSNQLVQDNLVRTSSSYIVHSHTFVYEKGQKCLEGIQNYNKICSGQISNAQDAKKTRCITKQNEKMQDNTSIMSASSTRRRQKKKSEVSPSP